MESHNYLVISDSLIPDQKENTPGGWWSNKLGIPYDELVTCTITEHTIAFRRRLRDIANISAQCVNNAQKIHQRYYATKPTQIVNGYTADTTPKLVWDSRLSQWALAT